MSTFSVPVCRVASVENHENADRLSIVKLEGLGFTCISGKLESGEHRYKVGDLVCYIPSAAILPEWLLKKMDFWNEETGKGTLSGPDGNRVKPLKLRGVFSEGVLYPVTVLGLPKQVLPVYDNWLWIYSVETENGTHIFANIPSGESQTAVQGMDMAETLGITKYSPPIPIGMAGEVANVPEALTHYDFDRWEQIPDIFEEGEHVVATEKLHGCADYNTIVDSLEFGPIKIGDLVTQRPAVCYVKSYDIASNELVYERVEGYSVQSNNDDWYEIEVEDGRIIKLTGNHPVWLPEFNCYRQARNLNGDEIVLID